MGKYITKDEFVKRAVQKHGNLYDYSKVVYEKSTKKVEIICSKHGSFFQMPKEHIIGHGCSKCFFDTLKKWTEREDLFLKQNYSERGARFCAEKLNKSVIQIYHRVKELKLTKIRKNKKYQDIHATFINAVLRRAKEDGREADIDAQFVWDLYLKQNKKCALTGWNIKFSTSNKENTCSLDRIDSSKGYTTDNVQLTHKAANRCKLDNTEEFFYKLCSAIVKNRKNSFISSEIEWVEDYYNDTIFPVKKEIFKRAEKSFNCDELF